MRFWNKELKEKATSRVTKMETDALVGWMDSSLMNFCSQFDEWRFRKGSSDLVSESLTILNSIWEELDRRS
jgi:hypothetical protein